MKLVYSGCLWGTPISDQQSPTPFGTQQTGCWGGPGTVGRYGCRPLSTHIHAVCGSRRGGRGRGGCTHGSLNRVRHPCKPLPTEPCSLHMLSSFVWARSAYFLVPTLSQQVVIFMHDFCWLIRFIASILLGWYSLVSSTSC